MYLLQMKQNTLPEYILNYLLLLYNRDASCFPD